MNAMYETQAWFGEFTSKAVEALGLWAEANQKVLGDVTDFSASTAREGVRVLAEIQAAAVEALREGQASWLRRQGEIQAWPKDPFGWSQKALLEGTEQTQKAFKVLEGNAQAIARSAQRIQAAADQTARGLQQTFTAFAEKTKVLYTSSQN